MVALSKKCIDIIQIKKEDDGNEHDIRDRNKGSNTWIIILIVSIAVFGLIALGVGLVIIKKKSLKQQIQSFSTTSIPNIPVSKLEEEIEENSFSGQLSEDVLQKTTLQYENLKNVIKKVYTNPQNTNLYTLIKSIEYVVGKNTNKTYNDAANLDISICVSNKQQQIDFQMVPTNNNNKAFVIVGDTIGVALNLSNLGKFLDYPISILNMANTISVGGGYLSGASAQEESLFRRSMLPWILDTKFGSTENLYPFTWNTEIITTTNVPFFRNETNDFFTPAKRLNVITAAAPNLNPTSKNYDRQSTQNYDLKMQKLFYNIIINGIELNSNNPGFIILGAIGCGAFKNPAPQVAQIAKTVIDNMDLKGNIIIFAIFNDKNGGGNVESFNQQFKTITVDQIPIN